MSSRKIKLGIYNTQSISVRFIGRVNQILYKIGLDSRGPALYTLTALSNQRTR